MKPVVHVIPLKNGLWRAVRMTSERYARWKSAWDHWFALKGERLAISPEMWIE